MTAAPHPLVAEAFRELKAGRPTQAEALCRARLGQQPEDAPALALLARVLHLRGDSTAAWPLALAAERADPAFVPALLELAAIARRRGDDAAAARALRRLAVLQPGNPGVRADLVQTLLRLGELDAARAEVDVYQRLAPGSPLAHLLSAQCLYAAGRADEALSALAAAPGLDHPDADLTAAQAHERLEQYRPAAEAYARVLRRDPSSAAVWAAYANALSFGKANPDAVLAARRQVIEREPGNGNGWLRYGEALRQCDRLAEAVDAYERAAALDPDLLAARWCAFQYPRHVVYPDDAARAEFGARWRRGLAEFERLELAAPRYAGELARLAAAPTNFFLHYLGEACVDEQRRYSAVLQRLAALAPWQRPALRAPHGGRRRVGVASPFLRGHTVSKLFLPMFERLPRAEFEVIGFQLEAETDATTERWRSFASRVESGTRDPLAWSQAIAAAELDALVVLDVGMHPTPQFLVAQRLAPLQCVLWGHPVTTGSPHVDLFLSSALMEPDDGDTHYRERLVRLPNLGCVYEPPTAAPDPAFTIAARATPGTVHFLVAQSVFKLTPAFDDALARIAAALPRARFSLTPYCAPALCAALERRIAAAFARHGVDAAGRLHLYPRLSLPEFLALAADADLNLDAFDWSGGNTTLEISACDTPTLTLPGALMRSRHTMAINLRLGLPELIAESADDYVARAVALGHEPARRAALRDRVAARKAALYHDDSVVTALAEVLRTAGSRE